jgi:hypothetical protein
MSHAGAAAQDGRPMHDDDDTPPDLDFDADGDDLGTSAKASDELPYGFKVRTGRPYVVCNAVNLADLTDGVLVLLGEHNDPPQLYLGPAGVTRIRRTTGQGVLRRSPRRLLSSSGGLVDRFFADRQPRMNALGMAIESRQAEGVVIHSDRGTQGSLQTAGVASID